MSERLPLWEERDLWFVDDETDEVWLERCKCVGTDGDGRNLWARQGQGGAWLEGQALFATEEDALRALSNRLAEQINELEKRRGAIRSRLYIVAEP